ncbi:MAG: ABC transporter ATP-binding protein [Deltaproteobacteria bacterium]|nr:MAG: ABC transporter ATP-binding protein [Deltaproteobacteria bacterium]
MRGKTLLKVSHIDVFQGSFQALWDVSVSVKSGEIVAIIGANGSGKSTLLDTISGLVHPAEGSIEFEGKNISALEPFQIVDLGISQTPEGRGIFPDLTVLENLKIGSYNRKARAERVQNLQRVYQLFPLLEERKVQLAKTLSGGEQQMLALGRGLMSHPRLMLLDEISLGLAPLLVNELYRALKEIRARGITILFVEQNARRSLIEADKAYIMEAGRVVLSGNVEDLREEEKVKRAYFGV